MRFASIAFFGFASMGGESKISGFCGTGIVVEPDRNTGRVRERLRDSGVESLTLDGNVPGPLSWRGWDALIEGVLAGKGVGVFGPPTFEVVDGLEVIGGEMLFRRVLVLLPCAVAEVV
jgi:hypothetical protein